MNWHPSLEGTLTRGRPSAYHAHSASFWSSTLNQHCSITQRFVTTFLNTFFHPSSTEDMLSDRVDLPSAAVFAPQSKEPKTEYLSPLREYLLKNSELSTFVQVIRELPDLWPLYSDHNPDLKALRHGLQGLQALSDWIETGSVNWIFKSTFGIVTLPLLTIIQIGQYFQFLQELRIKHGDLIRAVQSGAGIQGCCSGLITAIAVASSADEKELAQNACKALRVAVGVGAYSDLGVAGGPDAYALMVVRLKDEGQETQILEEFPVVSISLSLC